MNLFKNRPLAMFCLISIAVSCLIYGVSARVRTIAAISLAVILAVLITLSVLRRGIRFKAVFLSVCCVAALLAVLSHILLVDIKRERELAFEGNHTVRFLVVEDRYSSKNSSEYEIKIDEIDGEAVSIDSVAIYAYPAELRAGDIVYARAVISEVGTKALGYVRDHDSDIYIQTVIYEPYDSLLISRDNTSFAIFINGIRDGIAKHFDGIFSADTSALSRGFLIGDKSDIGTEVIRDFRRAGVSHLLAVSGLHVSVLMGACELILRKIGVRRGIRCFILSFVAIFFLALTGFAMSACRSVIMLLCVYFGYLFVRENDSVTFLFLSVALIMLISPHTVTDVGLWLSFLATLGIVSVYVPVSAYLHRRRKRGLAGTIRHVAEGVGFALLLTFICNIFICIVVWLVFGEISVVSLISNPILSPLSELFIIVVPISALIGKIPVIGTAVVKLTELLRYLIVKICADFSSVDGGVISLRYSFAGVIIVLMSVTIAVMLVIKLRHKWVIMLPPIAACIVFVICLFGYNSICSGEVQTVYFADSTNETVVLAERGSAAIIDISSGGYAFADTAVDIASENMATEIDTYVLTHYHRRHIPTLERLFRGVMLRRIYLPEPMSPDDVDIMINIVECAEKYGVDVSVYSERERITLLDNAWCAVLLKDTSEGTHRALSLAIGGGEELLSYIGAGNARGAVTESLTRSSDSIIFGHHGIKGERFDYPVDNERLKRVIYATRNIFSCSDVSTAEGTEIFVAEGRRIAFTLQ